ncbi:hypothetical protein B0T14DRAFT_558563 [Immersiella caudata]|uniref:Uncharacterized protein n=1 Tax=Immersiella caudata TaxID=314043 RepID=A0AA39WC33_9PEZI|nr:hypothetical protein B0T14DRAFT_558563 [Immersiella caudata]
MSCYMCVERIRCHEGGKIKVAPIVSAPVKAEKDIDVYRVDSDCEDVKVGLHRVTQDNIWSDEDSVRAEDEWRTRLEGKEMPASSENNALYKLYRSCLAFMLCFPQDIISPKFGMGYDIKQNETPDTEQEWTPEFRTLLKDLLNHPRWKGQYTMLSHAVYYTVHAMCSDTGS